MFDLLLIPLLALANRVQGIGKAGTGYPEDWLPLKIKLALDKVPQEGMTLMGISAAVMAYFTFGTWWAIAAGFVGPFVWRSMPGKGELANLHSKVPERAPAILHWPLRLVGLKPEKIVPYKLAGQFVRALIGGSVLFVGISWPNIQIGFLMLLLFAAIVPTASAIAFGIFKSAPRAWGLSETLAGAGMGLCLALL